MKWQSGCSGAGSSTGKAPEELKNREDERGAWGGQ